MKRLFALFAIPLLLATACVPEGAENTKYSLSLYGGSVTEGEPILLSLSVTGDRTGSFRFRGEASIINPLTGEESPADCSFLSGGEKILNGTILTFEENGHRDFSVEDRLAPGTYRFRISLDRDKQTASASSVVVVKKSEGGNGGGDNPPTPGPDDNIPVTSFSFPDGVVNDVLTMAPGDVVSYEPTVTPADATDKTFTGYSSAEDVATVVCDGPLVTLTAVAPGEAYITLTADGGKGMNRTFAVRVKKNDTPPEEETVNDFSIPPVDSDKGALCISYGDGYEFVPEVTPASAAGTAFKVTSSNPDVAEVVYENGKIRIISKYPGRASISITANDGNGITKTLPVLIYKDVKVTIDFLEVEATEIEMKTKTFPCKLRFSSDSDIAFPEPIVWTVTMKSVVNCTGQDSKTITDKTDVEFTGNKSAFYDIKEKMLIPSYQIWKRDHTVSLTLGLVFNNPLDSDLWRISVDDAYRRQNDAKIMEYIKEFIQ